jgi:hypothetical protein
MKGATLKIELFHSNLLVDDNTEVVTFKKGAQQTWKNGISVSLGLDVLK